MSLFSKNSLLGGYAGADYANTPFMDTSMKKSVVQDGANANLFLNSRDRNTTRNGSKSTQPYTNFVLQKQFPLLQGQINSIKVNEVMMPMPANINTYNNIGSLYVFDNAGNITGQYDMSGNYWGSGFYTGTEIQDKLNANPFLISEAISVVYNDDGTFSWIILPNPGVAGWGIAPYIPNGVTTITQLQSFFSTTPPEAMGLLWTLGFNNYISNSFSITIGTYRTGVASLLYTQYIDIVSDVLTQYQELTDTSTDTTNPNHIICRVYIANEVSIPQVDVSGNPVLPGTQYAIIHRQFKNPKILRWNGQNSVDRVDLRLLDDLGRPLYVPANGATDYQLVLSAVEL